MVNTMIKHLKNNEHFRVLSGDLRTIAGLALTFASLVALLMLASCAPKPVERVYPIPKTDFGPIQKDPNLDLNRVSTASITSSQLVWKETVDSGRVFRFGENMITLGKLYNSPELVKLGQKIGQAFYAAHGTATRTKLTQSLFVNAAIGETKDDVMPIIDEKDAMLASQLPIIHQLLVTSAATYPWPTVDTPPRVALAMAKVFAQQFLERAADSQLDHDVYLGVAAAFQTDFYPLLNGLSEEIDSILSEKNSVTMIDRLKAVALKYQFNLGDTTTKAISDARDVFLQIDAIEKNQDALTVIVQLWTMTDEANREKTFKPVSQQLYDFFKNKTPSDLRCIASPNCLNPLILIPKKVGLLPAIEKYGLDKLKVDIAGAAHDALVAQIAGAVATFVPTIPSELETKIADQVNKLRATIADVKSDYGGFIRGVATQYQEQNLHARKDKEVRVSGLESNRVGISLSPGLLRIVHGEQSSASLGESSRGPSSGSEVIGDSMAYAASIWNLGETETADYQKSVLSQVDKMLALGGYTTPSKKPYPSISISLDPAKPLEHFDIKNAISSKTPFAVPDSFSVGQDFVPKFGEEGKNVSVLGQAELLRGLASMTRYFRDWESNGFDKSMGAVEVGKLIKDLPAGSITTKLFPKDTFFALGVANAATILVNMTKQLSPVFLIDIAKKATWANDRSDDSVQPATMAGIVDIISGQRSLIVHSVDTARFLLAVADFLDATQGIEKTQAHPLITAGTDGKRPIDSLVDARNQLSMLVVGFANFLSHQMASKDGGIRSTFHQDSVSVSASEPRRAIDQAVCILALLKAGEVLGREIYDASALDAYAFMNTSLFNMKTGFYNSSEGSTNPPSLDEIATILLAGETLRSHMSNQSQDQWDMISKPWLKALEGLN